MKTFNAIGIALAAIMTLSAVNVYAQDELTNKERRQIKKELKESRKSLYQKSERAIRKEAKKLTKEGWKSMDLPLDKMIQRRNEKLWQDDAAGYPKYIHSSVTATGGSYAAANTSARTQAIVDLASQIQSTVAAMIDQSIANDETSPEMGASISQTLSDAKIIVAQKLGRIVNTGTMYRLQNKKVYEVRSTYIYDMRQAADLVEEAVMETLQDKSDKHREEFNKLFDFDRFSEAYENQHFDEDL